MDLFGFAERQEKAIYGSSYILILTGNEYGAVFNRACEKVNAKIVLKIISCYVPQYTLINQPQATIQRHDLIRAPTELNFLETSVFMKEKNKHTGTMDL